MIIGYIIIGIVVGLVCGAITFKEASDEFNYGFGDFLLVCLFSLSAFCFAGVLWPGAILVGILFLIYKWKEDELDDIVRSTRRVIKKDTESY